MPDLPLPLAFRGEIIKPVLTTAMEGDSCSLVGVGSSGKSNVARHLMREDVRAHWLGAASARLASALVDCQPLDPADRSTRPFHGAILEAILAGARRMNALSQAVPALNELWERATDANSTDDRARRAVADGLEVVFASGIERLVVILDDLDPLVQAAPPQALKSLRAFRDNHKSQLTYVTVTRRELPFLRPEVEIEDFYELIALTLPVGLYLETDALTMADQLIARWHLGQRVRPADKYWLLQLSGHHPGVLKAVLNAVRQNDDLVLSAPSTQARLQQDAGVIAEFTKIWDSLEAEEQDELASYAAGPASAPGAGTPARDMLTAKGLLRANGRGGVDAFSPLFLPFIAEHAARPTVQADISFDAASRSLRTSERTIVLSAVEGALFARIFERRPSAVPRLELLEVMWQAETSLQPRPGGQPEQRLRDHISRLAEVVDPARHTHLAIEPDGSVRLDQRA